MLSSDFDLKPGNVICWSLGPYHSIDGQAVDELIAREDTSIFWSVICVSDNCKQLGAVSSEGKSPVDWVPQSPRLKEVLAKYNHMFCWCLGFIVQSLMQACAGGVGFQDKLTDSDVWEVICRSTL